MRSILIRRLQMPFKSKAQRRRFAQLLVDGKITPEVYEEWNRETGGAHLPERVTKKSRKKPARGKRKTVRTGAGRNRKSTRGAARRRPAKKR